LAGKDAPLPTIFSVAKAGVEINKAATTAITISLILILKLYRTDMRISNKIVLFNQLFI
jgi:hypothetical protein